MRSARAATGQQLFTCVFSSTSFQWLVEQGSNYTVAFRGALFSGAQHNFPGRMHMHTNKCTPVQLITLLQTSQSSLDTCTPVTGTDIWHAR